MNSTIFLHSFCLASGSGGFTESLPGSLRHCKVKNATNTPNPFGFSPKFLCFLLWDNQFTCESLPSC